MNEVEKLRGLLARCDEYLAEKGVIRDAKLRREIRIALSQQAEPAPSQYSDVVSDGGMDPRNAPAPAQDEREAEAVAVVGYAYNLESGAYSQYPGVDWSPLMMVAQHERIVASLTRPAQTEQQPCGYQYQAPDGVWFPIAKSMIAEAEEHGHKVRPVYAAPIAQTDTCPACNGTGEGIDTGDCALVACMCNGTGKLPKE